MIDTTNRPELQSLEDAINGMNPDVYESNLNRINLMLGDYPLVWVAMFEDRVPDDDDDLAGQALSALDDLRHIEADEPLPGQRYV